LVGFALESKCHTGQTIIYDAVGKLGWAVDIRTHRIGTLIERLLIPDWDKEEASGKEESTAFVSDLLARPKIDKPNNRWFSWGWPWPRPGKGKRGHGDDDLDSGDPDDQPDEGDGDGDDGNEPEEPTDPAQPPPHKGKPSKSHVPKPQINSECRDCFKWEFFDDFGGKA
jgi:lipase ATG15